MHHEVNHRMCEKSRQPRDPTLPIPNCYHQGTFPLYSLFVLLLPDDGQVPTRYKERNWFGCAALWEWVCPSEFLSQMKLQEGPALLQTCFSSSRSEAAWRFVQWSWMLQRSGCHLSFLMKVPARGIDPQIHFAVSAEANIIPSHDHQRIQETSVLPPSSPRCHRRQIRRERLPWEARPAVQRANVDVYTVGIPIDPFSSTCSGY